MSNFGEMITFRGATDGAALTGSIPLTADILQAAITSIRIPRGGVLKIWGYRVSGAKSKFDVNFKKLTASADVPIETLAFDPALDSSINLEKRKPILVRGLAGQESISIGWTQAVAALSYIDIDIEICTPA